MYVYIYLIRVNLLFYVRIYAFTEALVLALTMSRQKHCKHQSSDNDNQFVLRSMTYAVHHRTKSLHLDDTLHSSCKDMPPCW